jgi:RNA polymerase sigma-70 factor (ECF subfamily)
LTLVPVEPPSDAALCQAFLEGDEAAFGELVRRHQQLVYRLVRRYAKTSDDALDLAQRAFLQAFEAARRTMPRLVQSGGELPFKAWVVRIAINLGKNHVRDTRRWPQAPVERVDVEQSAQADAQLKLERDDAERLTRQAVLTLPKRQREVFTLRIDAGLSFADVAGTLGITEGNAKSHFHYAVKRLRDEVHRLSAGEPS